MNRKIHPETIVLEVRGKISILHAELNRTISDFTKDFEQIQSDLDAPTAPTDEVAEPSSDVLD